MIYKYVHRENLSDLLPQLLIKFLFQFGEIYKQVLQTRIVTCGIFYNDTFIAHTVLEILTNSGFNVHLYAYFATREYKLRF